MSMTLNDLATRLKVSTATISRALSKPETVAPDTRKRVLEGVRRYGYQLNGIARSLRTQQTRTIGIIVPDIRNPFFSAIVKAVEDVARANDFTVLICNADEDGRNEEAAVRLFLDRQVSGVIHCSAGGNVQLLAALQRKAIPMIDLDRRSGLKHVDTVELDNALGALLAANHLLSLGHKRVAMISGPHHLSNSRNRLNGFRKALREADIPLPKEYVEFGDFREASGRRAAEKLLALSERPTALFVANNEMTAGALSALREQKIKIPDELSLVGFDDARWAQYSDPPLTIVAQPTGAMGKRAAELLLARIQNEKGATIEVFPPALIVRASTAPPR
jgi:DNA-binding LacI/PurR family transcriptional regulator